MKYFNECFKQLANLESFDRKAFIEDEKVSKDVCGFVLTLALIYTDIKNLSMLLECVIQSKPEGEFQISKKWGEFNGIINYLNRLHISIIHELFYFIEKNKNVINDSFFKKIIKSIKKETVAAWNDLVDISLEKVGTSKFAKELMLIRNKISYHYDHKIIYQGYQYMFENRKIVEKGYISRANNMASSRFYFADGAAESYLLSLCEDKKIENLFEPLRKNLYKINLSIWDIVTHFIQQRGYAFSKVN